MSSGRSGDSLLEFSSIKPGKSMNERVGTFGDSIFTPIASFLSSTLQSIISLLKAEIECISASSRNNLNDADKLISDISIGLLVTIFVGPLGRKVKPIDESKRLLLLLLWLPTTTIVGNMNGSPIDDSRFYIMIPFSIILFLFAMLSSSLWWLRSPSPYTKRLEIDDDILPALNNNHSF